ncbi:hypothetical protein GIB67_013682 [Kingdonia uniflora]|uniref:Uncharacterized protein n=1 Tax=Kingdonia uniflora TaxID=39325 RepID=A0A7J7NQK9_9MAGN|nr:hypothetical protein GIB67_013682 [Kingdonia uniflora]
MSSFSHSFFSLLLWKSDFIRSRVSAQNPLKQAVGNSRSRVTWLWLVTWHLGLFICLTFGQIGFKGRSESYF